MAPKKTESKEVEATIMKVGRASITALVVGTMPLILHSMSAKAKRELLLPSGRKNAAERKATLKHNPIEEYRDCIDMARRDDAPTAILGKATWFKGAMKTAALDIPGAFKSEIGRQAWVYGDYNADMIHIYGVPQLHMGVVIQGGMSKSPDIRTRAILPRWCCFVTISYAAPLLTEQQIINLLSAGGMLSGVGDWRPQKGSGSFGQYDLVGSDNPDALEIMSTGGREAQLAAIESPEYFNEETADLMAWYDSAIENRGLRKVA